MMQLNKPTQLNSEINFLLRLRFELSKFRQFHGYKSENFLFIVIKFFCVDYQK